MSTPESRIAISFIDEKYRGVISKTLESYGIINNAQLNFIAVENVIDDTAFTFKKACYMVNSLKEDGLTLFILGVSREFDIITAEAILKMKKDDKKIVLIIASHCDDAERCCKEYKERYIAIMNSADDILLLDHFLPDIP